MYRLLVFCCVSISALVASVPIVNPSQELVQDSGSDTSYIDSTVPQDSYNPSESTTDQNMFTPIADTTGIGANPSSTDLEANASENPGYLPNDGQQIDNEPEYSDEIAEAYDCNDNTQ